MSKRAPVLRLVLLSIALLRLFFTLTYPMYTIRSLCRYCKKSDVQPKEDNIRYFAALQVNYIGLDRLIQLQWI